MWNTLIVDPMTNILLLIYSLIGDFGLAIIIFTLVVKIVTHPLTASQLKSSAAMQDMQSSPQFLEMQKKYKDDKEKLSQETMKLYQELGVNPFSSCLTTLIQFPIIIGLYQAVNAALATSPMQLINFTRHIYSFFPNAAALVPLDSKFLWMDLGQPERLYIFGVGIPVLAILVTITSFGQSKLMTPPSTPGNDQAKMMSRMMSIYFPLLIGWMSFQFPAGLAVYFFVNNIFTMFQYALLGRIDFKKYLPWLKTENGPGTAATPVIKTIKKTKKVKSK